MRSDVESWESVPFGATWRCDDGRVVRLNVAGAADRGWNRFAVHYGGEADDGCLEPFLLKAFAIFETV